MRAEIEYINSASGHRLAVRQSSGKGPNIVFLGGFRSDMEGAKARAIEAFCQKHDFTSVCFDYSGHGASDGEFENLLLSDWIDDAQRVINHFVQGPVILVGSSMGAWITMIITSSLPSVVGVFGIASAPDFTERNIIPALTHLQKQSLEKLGHCVIPSEYDADGYTISNRFLDDARQYVLLDGPINIEVPVCLIHGQQDDDIPWQTSIEVMNQLVSTDVHCHLIKAGDHRLSRDQDIDDVLSLLAHFSRLWFKGNA